jgi:Flp pilus assembly protein TadB
MILLFALVGLVMGLVAAARGHWLCGLLVLFVPVLGLPFGIYGCLAKTRRQQLQEAELQRELLREIKQRRARKD